MKSLTYHLCTLHWIHFNRNEWKQKHHLTSALEENNGQANGNIRADDEEGAELKLLDSENNSKNVE